MIHWEKRMMIFGIFLIIRGYAQDIKSMDIIINGIPKVRNLKTGIISITTLKNKKYF